MKPNLCFKLWFLITCLAIPSACDEVLCRLYDYLNSRSISMRSMTLASSSFIHSKEDRITYFSLCQPLESQLVASTSLEKGSYQVITCMKGKGCKGLTNKHLIMTIPSRIEKETYFDIYYRDPFSGHPLVFTFPAKNSTGRSSATNNPMPVQTEYVFYRHIVNSKKEYETTNMLEYEIDTLLSYSTDVNDIYYFGTEHYWNSWVFTILAVSFMLSSVCFNNFKTPNLTLSPFIYFVHFYTIYRLIDTFYCVVYTPSIAITTSSVVIFPGVYAYIMTHFRSHFLNVLVFCRLWLKYFRSHDTDCLK